MSVDDLHILLIEDSETDRILIERLLVEALGANCRITRTIRLDEGLVCLEEQVVDAVMLDLTLPDSIGPGRSAMRSLKNHTRAVPFGPSRATSAHNGLPSSTQDPEWVKPSTSE